MAGWDASQAGLWCWWRNPGRPAHRARQGRSDSLCGGSVWGAEYVAPASENGRHDDNWCGLCMTLYKLPDHGSDIVRLERERDEALARASLAETALEALRGDAQKVVGFRGIVPAAMRRHLEVLAHRLKGGAGG